MKVLYVITGLGLGGAEKVVADLADQMVLRGHEVKIAYLKGDAIVKPKSQNVELIYLGLESSAKLFPVAYKYRNLIKSYQPDVVHAHMIHANIFARLCRVFSKVPKLICTAHNSNEGGKVRMLAYRMTNFLSNLNTNVSNEATKALIDKKAFKIDEVITVYNGIDLAKFSNKYSKGYIHSSNYNFLSVGRFNEQKDYPNLLKAISIVVQNNQNVHFNIAGDGDLREEIERLIIQLDIQKYVTLLGRRNDIPELMSKADCFILPSKYEGFGLVVAEAMACGIFVIGTDCGGVKEVMGNCGILVQPGNSEVLADVIIQFITMDYEKIAKNNVNASEYIQKNFDLNKIIDRWMDIYESK